jgi:hypothetical protein
MKPTAFAPTAVCIPFIRVCTIGFEMARHVRKNITLPRSKTARKRGTTQSGLIVHPVEAGLASEDLQIDRLLRFAGVIKGGPADLSQTIDETVYRL